MTSRTRRRSKLLFVLIPVLIAVSLGPLVLFWWMIGANANVSPDVMRWASMVSVGIGAVSTVAAIVSSWLLAKFVADPIRELAEGARAIVDGEFEYRIPIRSDDETGQLAADFNRMAEHVQKYVGELR